MQGAEAKLAKAEQALELALEASLTAGQSKKHDDACSIDSWPADMQDDYVDSDAEVAADADSDDSSADHRRPVSQQKQRDSGHAETSQGSSRLIDVVDESRPDNFSRVDLSRPQQEIKTQFPLFPVSAQELAAGHSAPAWFMCHVFVGTPSMSSLAFSLMHPVVVLSTCGVCQYVCGEMPCMPANSSACDTCQTCLATHAQELAAGHSGCGV